MSKKEMLKTALDFFKKHWKKVCFFVLCVSLGLSGYTFTCNKDKSFSCSKTPTKIPMVKEKNNVQ